MHTQRARAMTVLYLLWRGLRGSTSRLGGGALSARSSQPCSRSGEQDALASVPVTSPAPARGRLPCTCGAWGEGAGCQHGTLGVVVSALNQCMQQASSAAPPTGFTSPHSAHAAHLQVAATQLQRRRHAAAAAPRHPGVRQQGRRAGACTGLWMQHGIQQSRQAWRHARRQRRARAAQHRRRHGAIRHAHKGLVPGHQLKQADTQAPNVSGGGELSGGVLRVRWRGPHGRAAARDAGACAALLVLLLLCLR